jgi:glycosyltransferase involved in cell wall biosynthesis
MKTSIIIPVYNVEKYLENCVKSVLPLKSELEILLIDDGSTDQSGKICDSLAEKDSRIRVIHKENGGLSDARNVGIENSTGDYLMFLDSDDFLDTKETERLLSKITDNTDAAIGLYREFYEGENLYRDESCVSFLQNTGVMLANDFLKIVPKDGKSCYLTAWRFIVKRELIVKNNLYFFKGIYHEDEEWVPRLLFACDKINVTDCFFYCYRQAREGSITGTVKPKRVWDTFTILEHNKILLEQKNLNTVQKEFLLCRMAALFCNNVINSYVLNRNDSVKAFNELKKYYPYSKGNFYGLKNKLISISIMFFGISFTSKLIKAIKNPRVILK